MLASFSSLTGEKEKQYSVLAKNQQQLLAQIYDKATPVSFSSPCKLWVCLGVEQDFDQLHSTTGQRYTPTWLRG
jgi:hypothetical protein